jgi:methylmalonyl-CoA mutase N-terminal domain/subunit
LGGSLKAIETGWMQREVARAAYKQQKDVETCEKIMVGANSFKEEDETEVMTERLVAHPYDPRKREEAELTQIAKLKKLRRDRDNDSVKKALQRMQEAAKDEDVNLMPHILEAVKAYATIGEMCDALRSVFGEYRGFGVI